MESGKTLDIVEKRITANLVAFEDIPRALYGVTKNAVYSHFILI